MFTLKEIDQKGTVKRKKIENIRKIETLGRSLSLYRMNSEENCAPVSQSPFKSWEHNCRILYQLNFFHIVLLSLILDLSPSVANWHHCVGSFTPAVLCYRIKERIDLNIFKFF